MDSPLALLSALDRNGPRRRAASRALFPQATVPENSLDHVGLVPLDEAMI
jgi:hypothetical protein